ncbi:histidinol-phosphate transaminase [Naasia sp. SYSU D00948]|uniref:histidinol-phosphate transaminase n=1 Tax=Naasia sp. SYSU D00948 TaxID=2817379 RepID=UPI001B314418|nr:histidinol-phosphate transaminase [Naasia sp. SYSU D00948]
MTSLADLPLREDLRGRQPYGAPQRPARVALNVNENTHGVPEDVAEDIVAALREAVTTLHRYPDREFTALRESLARYLGHGVQVEQVWAGNGSNEVIQHVLQAFGGPARSVLGFPPTYSMHSILAGSTGTRWVEGERDEGFEISPETVVREIERTRPDLVFLCGPNNPTGTGLGLDTIRAAYEATDGIVFVDAAYAEFMPTDHENALTLLPGRERLIVSRTMSKAFAFAGARVGYMAADPAVVDALRLVRLPYHLSSLTQAAAIAALAHTGEMLARVDEIKEQRDRIERELPELGFSPWPSEANFVLFGGVADPARTWSELLERDVLVRNLSIPHTLRVSAGTEAETSEFLSALAEVGGAAA